MLNFLIDKLRVKNGEENGQALFEFLASSWVISLLGLVLLLDLYREFVWLECQWEGFNRLSISRFDFGRNGLQSINPYRMLSGFRFRENCRGSRVLYYLPNLDPRKTR